MIIVEILLESKFSFHFLACSPCQLFLGVLVFQNKISFRNISKRSAGGDCNETFIPVHTDVYWRVVREEKPGS